MGGEAVIRDLGALRIGDELDGGRMEWTARGRALVYFGPGRIEPIEDRPFIGTDRDLVVRVDLVHRCGTDRRIFEEGRREELEESLLEEVARAAGLPPARDPSTFAAVSGLLLDGAEDPALDDPLYAGLRARLRGKTVAERARLRAAARRSWGRVIGHEIAATVVHVGSRVAGIRDGIGYLHGERLAPEALAFRIGERVTVQPRVARYDPPLAAGLRGRQRLGDNIVNLAMSRDGGYAQYLRLGPAFLASGSVLRVPRGVSPRAAALAEPVACLLDCLQKGTHELGQGPPSARTGAGARPSGVAHKRGLLPGGATAVIGSGAMAVAAGMLALSGDPEVDVGGAAQVVFLVRSQRKADLVRSRLPAPEVRCVLCPPGTAREEVARAMRAEAPGGFDDVILAAGDREALARAGDLLAPSGGRIFAFAGTRGPIEIESGLWHYGNAATIGSSGCNTSMMETVLDLAARGGLDLERLSGRLYTFDDLREDPAAFFRDTYLRPCLAPWGGDDGGVRPAQRGGGGT